MSEASRLVSVEGNIGCGKSRALSYLQQFSTVQVHPEPVERWQDCDGTNILTSLYADPQRWAYLFHSYVNVTGVDILKSPMESNKQTKIIERSIDSNRFCFVELSRQLGNLTSSEYHSLKGLWKISKASTKPLDLIVYLRTDPEVAHARMTQRKRSEENTVSLDYLKALHECHEKWLVEKSFTDSNLPPVLVLDANQDASDLDRLFAKHKDILLGLEDL